MPQFDVTIAGELNLDLILYGLPETLPPERELLADNMALTLGSSSAIVAHNLAALGSRVGFVARIGDDPLGNIALQRLATSGVDVKTVIRTANTQTGLSVILQHGTWRNILTYPGTIFDLSLKDINLDYISNSRHFHLSSFYLQRGLRASLPDLFRELKKRGLTISLDPNDDPANEWRSDIKDLLQYVDIFMPNEREANKIAGTENIDEAISKLSQLVSVLVIKQGGRGARAHCGSESLISPASKVEIVDPVGAGDSFDAGFLHHYLRNADLQACLDAGNLTAALSTTSPGGTEAFRDPKYRDSFLRQGL